MMNPIDGDNRPRAADRDARAMWALGATVGVLAALFAISWLVTDHKKPEQKRVEVPRPKRPPFDPGTSIKIAGESIDIGTPVVLFSDPIGMNAYLERCITSKDIYPQSAGNPPKAGSSPKRYGVRIPQGKGPWVDRVRKRGWESAELKEQISQFVVHYDAVGTSERCFRGLHDARGLSVHFMLDLDGTIWQSLDVRERAFHAGDANDISVGVEIANIGARSPGQVKEFDEWYKKRIVDGKKDVVIEPPESARTGPQRIEDFIARPLRPDPIEGYVHGDRVVQYDYTAAQYDALAKLIVGLSKTLPKIKLQTPRDAKGQFSTKLLENSRRLTYQGIVGHYHLSGEKLDPGPAFQWQLLHDRIKALTKPK